MKPNLDGSIVQAFVLRLVLAFWQGNSYQPTESTMCRAIRGFCDFLGNEPGGDEAASMSFPAQEPSLNQAENYITTNLLRLSSLCDPAADRRAEMLKELTQEALRESCLKKTGNLTVSTTKLSAAKKNSSMRKKPPVSAAKGLLPSGSKSQKNHVVV